MTKVCYITCLLKRYSNVFWQALRAHSSDAVTLVGGFREKCDILCVWRAIPGMWVRCRAWQGDCSRNNGFGAVRYFEAARARKSGLFCLGFRAKLPSLAPTQSTEITRFYRGSPPRVFAGCGVGDWANQLAPVHTWIFGEGMKHWDGRETRP